MRPTKGLREYVDGLANLDDAIAMALWAKHVDDGASGDGSRLLPKEQARV